MFLKEGAESHRLALQYPLREIIERMENRILGLMAAKPATRARHVPSEGRACANSIR
jgi:hypothetical protein